jgi:serine/threonine protein kinase
MTPPVPRRAVALLIGISEYRQRDHIACLRYARRDARALFRVVTDPAVCGFHPDRVALLTDRHARREAVVRRLSGWLVEQGRGAELVLLYFAGHGVMQRVGARDEGFLLPYDADPDSIVSNGIAMSDVTRWIEAVEAGAVVVCLDCCHAGSILPREGLSLRGERDMEIHPSLLQGMAGKGRFLIAACDKGQKSIEVEELRHGLFTYHLLRGLRGDGDRDGDGRVGVAELFNYVSAAVSRDAREKFQREQTPWTSAIWNEDVWLSTPRPRTDTPLDPAPAPTPPLTPLTGAQADLLQALQGLRRRPDPAQAPLVFGALAERDEKLRRQARRALHAIGWERAAASVEELARRKEDSPLGPVLEGLAALEAHAQVTALLDRLVVLLGGEMRTRAILLLERKRLALELEKVAALFRTKNSPYKIEKVLGAGLFSAAYQAQAELGGLKVVVRVLRPVFAAQPVVRAQFLDLASRSVRHVHQNLVLTREARAFPECETYYSVRDYVDGPTLREVLESGRTFDPLQSIEILRQVVEGLTPLHRDGACHGGVKPSNIFITRDDRVILGDPSLPVPAPGWDLPRLAYDFRYVAPELFRGGATPGPAVDFYSLGCVAHELLRGAPPFVAESPYELIGRHQHEAPLFVLDPRDPLVRASQPLLVRLLAKTPQQRYPNVATLLEALDEVAAVLRAQQRPEAPLEYTLSPPGTPPESVHLLHDASLAGFEARQSIVPFAGSISESADGDPLRTMDTNAGLVGGPRMVSGARPEIPGYEILEELGRGGMGVVFKARHLRLDRLVAIKMIISGQYAGAEALARFQSEAQAIAQLQHPNIMQIHDVDECGTGAGACPYMAMELCEGGSLTEKLRGTPQHPQEAARLIAQLARAVEHAHRAGIIHRDLKPANVLFTADGTAKITDFGLAKKVNEEALTATGAIVGTPSYMAPEQAEGHAKRVGAAADVYALGAILYECLTGRPPFKGAGALETLRQVMSDEPLPPSRLAPKMPRELDNICLKCLQKEPARRYSTALALAEDLDRFLQGEPIAARPPSLWQRWRRWLPFGRP